MEADFNNDSYNEDLSDIQNELAHAISGLAITGAVAAGEYGAFPVMESLRGFVQAFMQFMVKQGLVTISEVMEVMQYAEVLSLNAMREAQERDEVEADFAARVFGEEIPEG